MGRENYEHMENSGGAPGSGDTGFQVSLHFNYYFKLNKIFNGKKLESIWRYGVNL